jgi:aspartyl-tRNA(Asn)/glutamyl-tRNA(Gln) amidotransferase subunit B
MNSFRSVERAVAFEIERQAELIDSGGAVRMETRGWSDDRGETYHMRSKETSDDYRYFPEPDLPPLRVDAAWLAGIRAELPELPAARRVRYQAALGLSAYDAGVLTADPDANRLFEATLVAAPALEAKPIANWVIGEYLRLRNAAPDPIAVDPVALGDLIGRVGNGSINRSSGRAVLEAHAATGDAIGAIVDRLGLAQISDAGAIEPIVDEVLAANPGAVDDVRAGKTQAIGFLVGQVMKASRGQANSAVANAAIRRRLGVEDGG